MNWDNYIPQGAVEAVTYADCVFWFDCNNEVIIQDNDIETFNKWIQETGETK